MFESSNTGMLVTKSLSFIQWIHVFQPDKFVQISNSIIIIYMQTLQLHHSVKIIRKAFFVIPFSKNDFSDGFVEYLDCSEGIFFSLGSSFSLPLYLSIFHHIIWIAVYLFLEYYRPRSHRIYRNIN